MTNLTPTQIKRIARREAKEAVQEQLAEQNATQDTSRDSPDDWAFSAMNGDDVMAAQKEQLASSEYVAEKYDVDPRNCSSKAEFESKIAEARAD